MNIILHIKTHCIETEARNEFKRLMDSFFTDDDTEGLIEARIEVLRAFIEQSDFARLRSSDSRFSGEVESEVMLKWGESGTVLHEFL